MSLLMQIIEADILKTGNFLTKWMNMVKVSAFMSVGAHKIADPIQRGDLCPFGAVPTSTSNVMP